MSTFLIIKPDFEKNHESEKGLDTIRQHAAGSASESGIKCGRQGTKSGAYGASS